MTNTNKTRYTMTPAADGTFAWHLEPVGNAGEYGKYRLPAAQLLGWATDGTEDLDVLMTAAEDALEAKGVIVLREQIAVEWDLARGVR